MMQRISAMLLCFLFAAAVGNGGDDWCDSLKALSGSNGYRLRGSGDRCEGIYLRSTGSPRFEVVSLLLNEFSYDLEKDEDIEVWFPGTDSLFGDTVRIRAFSLKQSAENYYYRMDGYFLQGERFSWPLSEVLAKIGLKAGNIGIYGWQELDRDKRYIPLHIKKPSAPDPVEDSSSLTLQVRWLVRIDNVKWRITEAENQAGEWTFIPRKPVPAARPITIEIPDGPAGPVSINVAALYRNKWSHETLNLIRP